MRTLLGVALGLPLAGAIATVLVARLADGRAARRAGSVSAVLTSAAWAIVVSAGTPPAVGRIEAHPLPAAAVAGLALLVGARLPRAPLAASSSLCAVTVFAVASTTGERGWPDRPLAVGVAALVLLVAVRLRAEASPRLDVASLAVAGVALTAGLLVRDEGVGASIAVAGALLAMVVAIRCGTALLLAPVTLFVAARTAEAAHVVGAPDDADVVAVSGVAAALLAAAAIHVSRRLGARRRRDGGTGRVLVVAVAIVAVVLLCQDPAAFRAAGALLAAGAVVAAASAHPLGLVACLPGAAAGVEAFGDATEPVHAAAGAVALVVLTAALVEPLTGTSVRRRDWALLPAFAFSVLPLWGWSGAADAGYAEAVTVAGATALVVATGVIVARSLPSDGTWSVGKLRGRPPAATHARTYPRAEEAVHRQVDRGVAPAIDG